MSIVYDVNDDGGVLYVVWDGPVTADDFLGYLRRLVADPGWPARRRLQLDDARTALPDRSIDRDVILAAVDILAAHPDKLMGAKLAVVATEAFDPALDFVHVFLEHLPSSIACHDLATACRWLGIDEAHADGVLERLRAQARGGAPAE